MGRAANISDMGRIPVTQWSKPAWANRFQESCEDLPVSKECSDGSESDQNRGGKVINGAVPILLTKEISEDKGKSGKAQVSLLDSLDLNREKEIPESMPQMAVVADSPDRQVSDDSITIEKSSDIEQCVATGDAPTNVGKKHISLSAGKKHLFLSLGSLALGKKHLSPRASSSTLSPALKFAGHGDNLLSPSALSMDRNKRKPLGEVSVCSMITDADGVRRPRRTFGESVRVLIIGGSECEGKPTHWSSPWKLYPERKLEEWEDAYDAALESAAFDIREILGEEQYSKYQSRALPEDTLQYFDLLKKQMLESVMSRHPAHISHRDQIMEAFGELDTDLRDWALAHPEVWRVDDEGYPELPHFAVPKQWQGLLFPAHNSGNGSSPAFPQNLEERSNLFKCIASTVSKVSPTSTLKEIEYVTLSLHAEPTEEECERVVAENKWIVRNLNAANAQKKDSTDVETPNLARIVFSDHISDTFPRFVMGAGVHESFDIVYFVDHCSWMDVVPAKFVGTGVDTLCPRPQFLADFKNLLKRHGVVVCANSQGKLCGFGQCMKIFDKHDVNRERISYLLSYIIAHEHGIYTFRHDGEQLLKKSKDKFTSRFSMPPKIKMGH